MKALQLHAPSPIENAPLARAELEVRSPGRKELLVKVSVCGVCRTDLHIVEGDLALPRLPLVPGHQVVGVVAETGKDTLRFKKGDRVGIPWLHSTCGMCEFCTSGRENLCEKGRFTGYHVDGGYAEFVAVKEDFAFNIPSSCDDVQAAPLLCAGVIGYRALRLSNVSPGQRIALYGFGASAHIALQVVRFWGCETYVFTRTEHHRHLAEELGAGWTGSIDEHPPHQTDAAVVFAPAGRIVITAMKNLKRGGTVSLAGIHMTPIPEMPYDLLYEERTLRSVANSTRNDVTELLDLADRIPIRTEVEEFPLEEANNVLLRLKQSELKASGVLRLG